MKLHNIIKGTIVSTHLLIFIKLKDVDRSVMFLMAFLKIQQKENFIKHIIHIKTHLIIQVD